MKLSRILGVAAAAVALTLASGCTQQRTETRQPTTVSAPEKPADPAPRRAGWPTRSSTESLVWSGIAYPTGNPETSAIGIEKIMPREARLNQQFDYDIVVTNLTGTTLTNVVVTDQLGDYFKLVDSNPTGRMAADGVTIWALGEMGPHESRTIRISGVPTGVGEIACCTEVSWDSLLCLKVPVVEPKLRITKSGPAEVLRCEEITYRIEVSNPGTGRVDNVVVTDPLPAGLTTADGSRSITIDAGSIEPGKTKSYTASVVASRAGTYKNTASANGEGVDSVNSGVVTTVVKAPVLEIEKECPGEQYINRSIEYRITVKNSGDGEARNTVVTDSVPSGSTFVTAGQGGQVSGGRLSWDLGTLAPGASRTVTYRVQPNGPGTYGSTARAECYCADVVTDDCATVAKGIPAILLEVVDLVDPVKVGDDTTYVITVTNQGSAVDTNIVIECELEAEETYVSSSGDTRGTARGKTITFAPIGSLAPGEVATFRVVVKANAVADARFHVTMNSDQLTRPVAENEATNLYE